MADLILNAEVRTKTGKGDARKLRAAGRIPAVVYGHDMQPMHISLHRVATEKIIRKANRNALFHLDLSNSESKKVIIREFQKHPISHEYAHVDFQAVTMDKPIAIDVDLDFVGTPIGKKFGGIFAVLSKQVKIECLPEKIPESIKLDVTSLNTGDSLHVSDLKSGDYEVLTNSDIALCRVSIVKEEETVAETTEAAEGTETTEATTAEAAKTDAPQAKA